MTKWGKITLWEAAADGDVEMCKTRLQASYTDVNGLTKDSTGVAAIHEAAKWGNKDVVSLLLEHNAKVDIASASGRTALHFAAENGKDDVVELLLANGANINALDRNNDTPLHLASSKGKLSTVLLLASKGADTTIQNHDRKTAQKAAANPDISKALSTQSYVSPTQY
mmetsp:Transcript_39722/g.100076  ORF Transcript_39722/g.100076 Transcript_39722/m.100076 type:complete len:168 (+) Transcript_39722:88-591(+)